MAISQGIEATATQAVSIARCWSDLKDETSLGNQSLESFKKFNRSRIKNVVFGASYKSMSQLR